MALTLVEKIATAYAVGLEDSQCARQGQIVRIRPKHVMTHDNTGAVIPKFASIFDGTGKEPKVFDPSQPVFAIDHDIQNTTEINLGKYAKIAGFAAKHGIDHYPAGTGISHQVMVEQGYAIPGALIVGSDSHSNMYGGIGALGTPVVRTDAACIWATGQTWWQVPRVARCTLTGTLQSGVSGKDVIITLCGLFNQDQVLNCAVEFVGEGVGHLSMDHRLTIANMTTEWGALAGVFPFDATLKTYLQARADYFAANKRPGERRRGSKGSYTRDDVERWYNSKLVADADAHYAVDLSLDLSTVTPYVSGPNHVKVMHPVSEMEAKQLKIQKAYLLSCTNARFADIAEAAAVVKDKKVASGVSFYVAAASADVQKQAEHAGHWQTLVDAGAKPLPSGCGPCIGLGTGLVEDGEVAISATNRNFKGRMGSRDAEVYLGSPAVVAASAVAGYICSPTKSNGTKPVGSVRINTAGKKDSQSAELLNGFPATVTGRALYMHADNMNTDGIYAGKHTYNDAITPDQMKDLIFENYDPNFNSLYTPGDFIIGGRNFGTGSSREQAATALKYRGIPCVIAASFSETYLRNAFNNGFLCIECAELVDHLKSSHASGTASPTVVGPTLTIDFGASEIRCGTHTFTFTPLSPVAQELIVAGGAEAIAQGNVV